MSTRTSEIQHISSDLENMLTEIMHKTGMFAPVSKHHIKYKNFSIIKQDKGWMVLKDRQKIADTFLKVSAFALCKLYEKNQSKHIDETKKLDSVFQKNYIDSLFYKHTLKTSKDPIKLDNALWRYEISSTKAKDAKQKIDKTFYSSIR